MTPQFNEIVTHIFEKKDACYHKVKKVYSKSGWWTSPYSGGALAKCRKMGARNWNKKDK